LVLRPFTPLTKMVFPTLFSRGSRKSTDNVRWFGGISITTSCQRIESAVIGVHGRGNGAPVEIRKTIAFDVPREIVDSFNELQNTLSHQEQQCAVGKSEDVTIPASLSLHVARELASIEEEAVQELISESKLTVNDILAVGVYDPPTTFWQSEYMIPACVRRPLTESFIRDFATLHVWLNRPV